MMNMVACKPSLESTLAFNAGAHVTAHIETWYAKQVADCEIATMHNPSQVSSLQKIR